MTDIASSDAARTLHHLIAEAVDLRHAADLVEWDERVYMPSGGASTHGEMQATLRRLSHERFTSVAVRDALAHLAEQVKGQNPDGDEYRLLRVTERDHARATRVPSEFVAEHAQVVSAAQAAWTEARAASNFLQFRPHLERIVELKKRFVDFYLPADHPYDVLLDEYEPGLKTAEVQRLFDALRPRQVALLKAIAGRPQGDDRCLSASYPEGALWDFAVEVITAFGFDWRRGRQDKSAHPFASAFGSDDVRITTRWVDQQPLSLLFGTMHEAGHGLYEQGVSLRYHRTMLEGGASLGVHESQSRLWENLVGRSRSFWQCFLPALQARCPTQLAHVSLDEFYRAVNRVQPSLIRVEADEATYNLHVMLRVEIEMGLIEGRLRVRDLPDIWASRMRDYLGIVPDCDARGVLQDIHWAAGLFGYFATYTIGNLVSAQLWEAFGRAHPERDDEIARGQCSGLLGWLRTELHQHGRKYEPQELVARITGHQIDPEPYLRYLETKYRAIYGIA